MSNVHETKYNRLENRQRRMVEERKDVWELFWQTTMVAGMPERLNVGSLKINRKKEYTLRDSVFIFLMHCARQGIIFKCPIMWRGESRHGEFVRFDITTFEFYDYTILEEDKYPHGYRWGM